MTCEEAFRDALRQSGIEYSGPICDDGKLHRIKAKGDHAKNSWYVLHSGSPVLGAYGCWKRNINETWCERNGSLTEEENENVRRRQEAISAKLKDETAAAQEKARKTAEWILNRSRPARTLHGYLSRKRVKVFGNLRVYRRFLVLPLRDAGGELRSLQFIDGNGAKKFLTGGRVAGCFFTLADKAEGPLVITEGYTTGASIHEATGHAVICAMNKGNLLEVTKAARELWPHLPIIVAADNDQFTDGNPGLTKATSAAKAIGARLAVPQFGDLTNRPTDFNDLAVAQGLDAVREQIAFARIPEEIDVQSEARSSGEWATDLSSFTSLDDARFPAPLEDAAYCGLAGKIVQRILPETEAHPAALLFTILAGFGNMIGRSAYMIADGARHHLNLFVVTVGRTSISRKGTAWVRVRPVLELIDEDWVHNNVESGLSSGEGVIHRIRNKIDEEKPIKEKGRYTGQYETVTVDPGIDDKRLFVLETEFCSPLKVMNREGNTLSPVLRAAWDGDDLGTLTKNSRERATEPHFSMIGHITREELRRNLNETEAANGFGNRNLWIAAKRSKSLPRGGQIPSFADFVDPLGEALLFAQTCGELRRDDEAEELWAEVYPELSGGKPGLLGAIIARAAPQILRISGLYAVLDCSPLIRAPHLKAALACWRYAEASARWIFETGTGNKVADRILAALIQAGVTGLTKTQIVHDLFNRNVTKFTIDEALRLLHHLEVAECEMESTKGRPTERWFFKSIDDINDKNDRREAI
jgi:phage/plasmid primase-like uncharacterized protein